MLSLLPFSYPESVFLFQVLSFAGVFLFFLSIIKPSGDSLLQKRSIIPDWGGGMHLSHSNTNMKFKQIFFFKKNQTLKIVMNCCRTLLYVIGRILCWYDSFSRHVGIMDIVFDLTIPVLGIYSKEVIMDVDKDLLKHYSQDLLKHYFWNSEKLQAN